MKQRGRPKGRHSNASANCSFGPLGDLVRIKRIEKQLGLADIAKICGCSVQFISNIEHGRAPLPWEKLPLLASALKVSEEELKAANFAIRADFKNFVGAIPPQKGKEKLILGQVSGTANALVIAANDQQLREIIHRYNEASIKSRKKFVKFALENL